MIQLQEIKRYTENMNVLYVEDDEMIQSQMRTFLERVFLSVDIANNGIEGLELYKNKSYDLVISDIAMPHMNGIEMTKSMMKIKPEQQVVIISAHNEPDQLLELLNARIKYYALKPINLDQLKKVLLKISKANFENKSSNIHDISDKNNTLETQKIIKSQNHQNNLTGLDNLYLLIQQINKHQNENKDFIALILLDIDNLEYINNAYSREKGNEVLISFSKMLTNFAQDNSYKLFHISGDQFTLLHTDSYLDTDLYEKDINKLLDEIKNFSVDMRDDKSPISINATIGASFGDKYPLEHADMALKYAKENHKHYSVYNSLMDRVSEIKNKLEVRKKIDTAIINNNIMPVYQPIVDRDGNIIKYEALMRIVELIDEKQNFIYPNDFLDIAIESKQYEQISSILIFKVLDFMLTNEYKISINMTYSDFVNREFIEELFEYIKKNNLGNRLIIEITENENILDYKVLEKGIKRFRSQGVNIAIDDFGSGYSNFTQILEICPEYIKIDGTLIQNIDIDSCSLILTKAITSFSKEFGFKVIAEYVHSKEVFNILKEFDIDEYQGYYFSEPIPDP